MGKTGYTIDDGTVKWAEKRVAQLNAADRFIRESVLHLEQTVGSLDEAATLMDEQPDSDMIRSFQLDVEKMIKDLTDRHGKINDDRRAIQEAIKKFEEEQG